MGGSETDIPPQQQEWPGRTDAMEPRPDHGESSYVGRDRLTGKRALVTGGDSGIGRATAIAFAKEGADVAISFLPEEQGDAEETRRAVEAAGRRCLVLPTDQRTEEANRDLAGAALEGLGGIDVLVSNAAFQMGRQTGIENFTDSQLRQVFETNVFATFWLVKAVAPHLGAGASIAITTSIQAYDPSQPLLDYAATKAALNNLMVNLAAELGPRGIRVNAVAPGPIWTPLIPSTFDAEKVASFGADTPLGRAGQPVEVASAFVFLASDDASYVSGTVVGVTGGRAVF
ncbi:short-chain dehydrogenase/reductase SDR [Beutenbergia cavernae DSM 12333]|uniref:Short-chain dehydrogenase/reductase SDR n=1 Tax=Beutenbergia cavernae (strain ATCC BAA-8 / DSM 12333 / CCUG 43141 / JCM 11478 / NBRC 16432 / NCIMB 13614 / HKI 0122) TaxID=471853 RepID=C5C4F6_BEUC1|nr:SDR family oxidoreductase [Beutenbergia cavernae]ACQ82080.1 short-chain dehydrogenase/reductase SDR [Beutenbergia cavernae DSM 12333]